MHVHSKNIELFGWVFTMKISTTYYIWFSVCKNQRIVTSAVHFYLNGIFALKNTFKTWTMNLRNASH